MQRARHPLDEEETRIHRVTLFVTAVGMPLFGVLYNHLAPDETDPVGPRLALAALSLAGGLAATLSATGRRHVLPIAFVTAELIGLWIVYLTVANDFSPGRVMGLALTQFCASFLFTDVRYNLALNGSLALPILLALLLGPEAHAHGVMLLAIMVTSGLFSAISMHRRRSTMSALMLREEELEEARATLEVRVRERTQALEREVVERREAERRASEASRAKSQFLANMSHELRTPLNAVIGYTEIVREDLTGEASTDDLDRVLRSAHLLLRMINDILDLAKVESGSWDFASDPLDVAEVVAQSCATVGPLALQQGNTLQVEVEPELPVFYGDQHRLVQILVNLLSNAAKFTEQGVIQVSAGRADVGGAPHLVIGVQDTGCGIAEESLEQVFDKFVQIDGSSTRRHDGTGLGLAICREMTRAFGGTLQARSAVGVGSTFTARLPWRDAPDATASRRSAAA